VCFASITAVIIWAIVILLISIMASFSTKGFRWHVKITCFVSCFYFSRATWCLANVNTKHIYRGPVQQIVLLNRFPMLGGKTQTLIN
jgi:hypothetical protein